MKFNHKATISNQKATRKATRKKHTRRATRKQQKEKANMERSHCEPERNKNATRTANIESKQGATIKQAKSNKNSIQGKQP